MGRPRRRLHAGFESAEKSRVEFRSMSDVQSDGSTLILQVPRSGRYQEHSGRSRPESACAAGGAREPIAAGACRSAPRQSPLARKAEIAHQATEVGSTRRSRCPPSVWTSTQRRRAARIRPLLRRRDRADDREHLRGEGDVAAAGRHRARDGRLHVRVRVRGARHRQRHGCGELSCRALIGWRSDGGAHSYWSASRVRADGGVGLLNTSLRDAHPRRACLNRREILSLCGRGDLRLG